jgi:hypothetical protein
MKSMFRKTPRNTKSLCDHCKQPQDYLERCDCGKSFCGYCSPLMHHDCSTLDAVEKDLLLVLFGAQ